MLKPKVTYDVPTRLWRLVETYVYRDQFDIIRIPAGFRFDLASIPRILWRLVAPFELSLAAPLVHDWLYRHAGILPEGVVYTRDEADTLFLNIMRRERVGWLRRTLAYYAVRLFGRWAWRYHPEV